MSCVTQSLQPRTIWQIGDTSSWTRPLGPSSRRCWIGRRFTGLRSTSCSPSLSLGLTDSLADWKRPIPLRDGHVLAGFTCGKDALDEWLVRRAAASQVSGAARTYVVEADSRVVGYFSLATASVVHADLPGRAKRNMPNPVPAVLLTRFATDIRYQGKGLGAAMLRSALEQVKRAADVVGVVCLLVHAKDEDAKSFYFRYGFEPSPTDALHLILLLKDVSPTLTC